MNMNYDIYFYQALGDQEKHVFPTYNPQAHKDKRIIQSVPWYRLTYTHMNRDALLLIFPGYC